LVCRRTRSGRAGKHAGVAMLSQVLGVKNMELLSLKTK
jgi:hypothetical protein